MKKIFTTLAVAAISVASVFAGQPLTAVQTASNADFKSVKATEALTLTPPSRLAPAKKAATKRIAQPKRAVSVNALKPTATTNGMRQKAHIANLERLGKPMSWEAAKKAFLSDEVSAKSNLALPAKPAKVKAKVATATPTSIDELVATPWVGSYSGMLESNRGNHEGEATFVYYEEYDELDLILPDCNQGLFCGYENGNLIIYNSVGYGSNANGNTVLCPINASTGAMITSSNVTVPFNSETGEFEFPSTFAWGLCAVNPTTGALAGYYWAAANFSLKVSEGDYSIKVTTGDVCTADNKFTLSVTAGADVASLKYMVVPFDAAASDYGSNIASSGQPMTVGQVYTIDPVNDNFSGEAMTESGYASVLIGAYDANGNLKKATQQAFIVVLDKDGWKNVGEIDYEDQLFAQYYNNFSHTQKAMLQAKEGHPGLYRVVDPYSERNGLHSTTCGNHSFMINIADPEWVEIPFSVSGLDLAGDGILTFGSFVALGYDKASAQEKGLKSGTLNGQTATFPVKTILAHEQYYNEPGSWSYMNNSAEVTFTFPDVNLNIIVIDTNNKPVEGATVVLGEETATTDAEGKATVTAPFENGYFATVKPTVNDKEFEVTLCGAETNYTAIVEAAEPEPEPVKAQVVDFDFLTHTYYIENQKLNNNDNSSKYFTTASVDSLGVKIDFSTTNGNGFRFWTDGLRLYKGNVTMTITAPGHVISAINLNAAGNLGTVTVNGNSESTNIGSGSTLLNGENLETVTLDFKVTTNRAIKTLSIALDGTAGEFPKEVIEFADIAAFLAAKNANATSVITGEVAVTYQNGKYLFVTDASGSLEVYGDVDKTYTNGTVLKNISGTYNDYYKMPQFAPEAASFTAGTQGAAVAPVEYDAETVELGQYVKFTNVELTENNGKYYADGVQLYDQFKIEGLELKAAEKATVVGIYGCYNSTMEVFVISVTYGDEPVVDPDPEPTQTWTKLDGKGKYAASVLVDWYGASATPVEVDVYECDQTPGVYKFVGVWPDLMENGELIIDATDPNFVIIPVQNTGFVDDIDGPTYIASFSAFNAGDEDAKADMIEYAPEYLITLKDGLMTIPVESMFIAWPEAPADSEYETDPEAWYYGNPETEGFAALPGAEIPTPDVPEGTTKAYINCYEPFFSNWDATKTLTEVVYVTYFDDNTVEIDGLGRLGVNASGNDNLKGIYDPEAKTITIPGGQTLGTYAGQYTIVCFTGIAGSTSLYDGDLIFKVTEDGQLVIDGEFNLYYVGLMSGESLAAGWAALINPVLKPANATISYEYTADGETWNEINEPFYYEVVTDGDTKYIRTSNVANRAGEGYMVEWVIDEETQTAAATDAATYNSSSSGDFILQSSATGEDLTTTVVANIADINNIIFPEAGYWTCLTASGYWFGLNSPATISGTPVYVDLTPAAPEAPIHVTYGDAEEPVALVYNEEEGAYTHTFPTGTTEFTLSLAEPQSRAEGSNLVLADAESIADNTGETKYDLEQGTGSIAFAYSEGEWTVHVDLEDMKIWGTNATMTGIRSVSAESVAPAQYFNLQGQRIAAPTAPGIYIINNRKVVVK